MRGARRRHDVQVVRRVAGHIAAAANSLFEEGQRKATVVADRGNRGSGLRRRAVRDEQRDRGVGHDDRQHDGDHHFDHRQALL